VKGGSGQAGSWQCGDLGKEIRSFTPSCPPLQTGGGTTPKLRALLPLRKLRRNRGAGWFALSRGRSRARAQGALLRRVTGFGRMRRTVSALREGGTAFLR
jgi:hypothetical protein